MEKLPEMSRAEGRQKLRQTIRDRLTKYRKLEED